MKNCGVLCNPTKGLFYLHRKGEYKLGKCFLGECPASKTEKDICCLDCDELELCLEKNYTCLHTLKSRISENCNEYIKNDKENE